MLVYVFGVYCELCIVLFCLRCLLFCFFVVLLYFRPHVYLHLFLFILSAFLMFIVLFLSFYFLHLSFCLLHSFVVSLFLWGLLVCVEFSSISLFIVLFLFSFYPPAGCVCSFCWVYFSAYCLVLFCSAEWHRWGLFVDFGWFCFWVKMRIVLVLCVLVPVSFHPSISDCRIKFLCKISDIYKDFSLLIDSS